MVRVQADPVSDELLAKQVQRRTRSSAGLSEATRAFETLYRRHSRLLLAFLSSRVQKSDLEDVHQSVWQKIWQYLPQQFRGGNFRAWMYQIARNHLIDVSRKRRPDVLGEIDEPLDHHSSPDAPIADRERQEILSRCMEKLQDEMASIVRSRLSGEDYQDICSRLEIVPAKAHKLFFKAREQLSGCVKKAMQ